VPVPHSEGGDDARTCEAGAGDPADSVVQVVAEAGSEGDQDDERHGLSPVHLERQSRDDDLTGNDDADPQHGVGEGRQAAEKGDDPVMQLRGHHQRASEP